MSEARANVNSEDYCFQNYYYQKLLLPKLLLMLDSLPATKEREALLLVTHTMKRILMGVCAD